MDVRAMVVLGPSNGFDDSQQELIADAPIAFADVLGKPVIFRVVEDLKSNDVNSVTVVTDAATKDWPTGTAAHGTWISSASDQLWRTVEQTFADASHSGAEL